jgi:hypothetical protein
LDIRSCLEVLVEATGEPDITVNLEDYGHGLRSGAHRFEYRIVAADEKKAVPLPDAKLLWSARYVLAFVLPGEYELPGAHLTFVDLRRGAIDSKDNDTPDRLEVNELRTESVKITVTGFDAASTTEADLGRITVLDPVELPRPWSWWWIMPVAAVLLIPLLAWSRRSRRGSGAEAFVPLPHEWAWRQIALLIADDLIGRGRVQEFYYRISDIVRGYIERRFAVSAPEMTTEEFLEAAASDPRFTPDHRAELSRFSEACDLVKYARHVPQSGESDTLLAATRRFIDQTREHSVTEQRQDSRLAMTERAA